MASEPYRLQIHIADGRIRRPRPSGPSAAGLRADAAATIARLDILLERAERAPRNDYHLLTRSAPKPPLRCGVCGDRFSIDPPCCAFGFDVASGRVR